MNEQIVKIDPVEFGLTDETAKNIQQQFEPMLAKMVELEEDFNKIISLSPEEEQTTLLARELRLKYVKVRTGTSDIHKAQKAFFLNGGRFVDGWKNAQLFASQNKEERLAEIENHRANVLKKAITELQEKRASLIGLYVNEIRNDLGVMEQDVFDAYLSAKKQAYEDRIAAEKKAQEDAEHAAAEERKRIEEQAKENERLKVEAQEREAEMKAEREYAEAQRRMIEEKAAKEKEESEKKIKEEKEKLEAAQAELKRKEKEEQNRIAEQKKEEELKLKQQQQEEIEEKKRLEKLAKAPVKRQLAAWVETFSIVDPSFHNETTLEIKNKFESFKNWAKKEIESL